ncbi:GNAT family N-acetyltransferase [Terrabacter sp. NPDC080008]|uniref:GNAT family N-acetyltransferase n=1 Tax=Terrabacter sp. NPDC080008 TaxID=3155176 RepID=UPI00344CCF69
MTTELRVIGPDEWEEFRSVRLAALADSPDAFGATLGESMGKAPSEWRERAAGADPIVLAYAQDRPVAMGGLYAPNESSEAFVWGMWVQPTHRGRGVAARILQRLLEYADHVGRPVTLHVTQGNDGARRLYERHGFTATGEVQPLREGSSVRIETMQRR